MLAHTLGTIVQGVSDEIVLAEEELEPAPSEAQGERGLARYDALRAYVQQARRFPLLAPEEERRLARHYRLTGDVESARRLVTANLLLVVKIAREYRRAYGNLLDLVQDGNVGLMHAVRHFDPERGVKLTTYSAWWIRAYILKFVMANWRLVKVGTSQAERRLFYNLKKQREKLERLGIDPGPRLLAEHLDVSEADVVQMQGRLQASDASLDAPVHEGEDGTRLDAIRATSEGPDRAVEQEEFQRLLRGKLETFGATLQGRDRTIFEERLLGEEPKTLAEIGQKYGVTRERARQIEKRLLERLREYLRAELGEAVEIAAGEE